MYPAHITKNPMLIEKKAIASLNKVGLPVFLKPTSETIPIASPTTNPTRLRIFSNKNSNYAKFPQVNYFNLMDTFSI